MRNFMLLFVLVMSLTLLLIPKHTSANDQICFEVSRLARTVMKLRQAGMPKSQVLEICSSSDDALVRATLFALVNKAFEKPRFMSYEARERAIQRFEYQIFLTCASAE